MKSLDRFLASTDPEPTLFHVCWQAPNKATVPPADLLRWMQSLWRRVSDFGDVAIPCLSSAQIKLCQLDPEFQIRSFDVILVRGDRPPRKCELR